MTWLSTFAVDIRYPLAPGLATTREHAERAMRIAECVKTICVRQITDQPITDNR